MSINLLFKRMRKISIILTILCTAFCSYGQGVYTGTGSVTQGLATTTISNLFPGCSGGRVSAVGTISDSLGNAWTVPSETNFSAGPYLPDLYNQCSGVTPGSIASVPLSSLPVTVIDPSGDTITAFIFGDNYFEYVLKNSLNTNTYDID